jgi:LCP family protein required for cell wall assembly
VLSLVLSIAYASASIYQWARQVGRAVPAAILTPPERPEVAQQAAGSDAEPAQLPPAAVPAAPQPATSQADLPPPVLRPGQRERVTVLLLGVDQRPDETGPSRTDNMMVVTADLATGKVGMISLPRDMIVPIPGTDRSGKINTAYFVGELRRESGGGGQLAKATVSDLLGYPIDYYVKIDFDGFVRIVDLIGGIDVDLPRTIHDEEYPTLDYGVTTFHLDAGPQHLDGETALQYVRTRHGDDDFERARRQQQALVAIKDQVVANKLLTTLKIFDLVDAVSDAVEHDIPPAELLDLVGLATQIRLDQIDQLVLDNRFGKIDTDSPYGWIVVPDREKIRPAVDRIFASASTPPAIDNEALARLKAEQQADLDRQRIRNSYQAQADEMRARLATENASIILEDGTGDPTLAGRVADWLRAQGYNVVRVGQAEATDYARSHLVVSADKPFTTASLRASFAVAENNVHQEAIPGADLRLVVGRDFYLLVSN